MKSLALRIRSGLHMMCRIESSLCGCLTLRSGSFAIGWCLLTLAMITSLSEMASPWTHKAFHVEYSKAWSRALIAEAITLAFACIVLLMGLYEERPALLLVWLTVVAVQMVLSLTESVLRMPYGKSTSTVFWHLESMAVHIGVMFYMFIVVLNEYLNTRGTGRSILGDEEVVETRRESQRNLSLK